MKVNKSKKIVGLSILMGGLLWGAVAAAQSGPTAGGETGSFTVINADTLGARQWSAGWYVNSYDRFAASVPAIGPLRDYKTTAYDLNVISMSLAYGITDQWEVAGSVPFAMIRQYVPKTHGEINGIQVGERINVSDMGAVHVGTKFRLWDSSDRDLRLALFAGVDIPTRGDREDANLLQTGRYDWNVGAAFTARYITFQSNYLKRGDTDFADIPNEFHNALGVEIPATPNLNVIWEIAHTSYKTSEARPSHNRAPRDITETTAGMRYFVNSSVALNVGARLNMSEALGKRVSEHSPVGWVAGISYFPRKKGAGDTTVEAYGSSRKGGTKAMTPACPVITVPVSGATVATARPSISGTAEANATVKISVDGAPAQEVKADASGSWSAMVGSLSEGAHAAAATQTNAAGLSSDACPATRFSVAIPVEEKKPVVEEKKAPRVTTDKVLFSPNSSRLSNIAKAVLDQVALRMKSEGSASALAIGYADGSEKGDMKLSKARAEACKEYLVKRHSIDASRINVEAKGKAEPEGDNKSKDGRAQNRRTVIRLTIEG